MTYNVFSGTLNPTQSINLCLVSVLFCIIAICFVLRAVFRRNITMMIIINEAGKQQQYWLWRNASIPNKNVLRKFSANLYNVCLYCHLHFNIPIFHKGCGERHRLPIVLIVRLTNWPLLVHILIQKIMNKRFRQM